MTDTTTPLDHMNAAIEALDVEIADINARQVALADRADELGAARRDLVELRDRFPGAVPAGDPGKPQSVAPEATSARASARRSAPPKKKAAAKKAVAQSKYDYAEVARVACEAIAEGRNATDAVMEAFDAKSRGAAQMAISTARKQGHDIPKVRPTGRPKKAAAEPTATSSQSTPANPDDDYACASCDETRATEDGLRNHTWEQHGRPPKIAELKGRTAA